MDDPRPKATDVVVQVAAVGLNRLDLLQRSGPGLLPGFSLPHIAGMDVTGEVVAAGADAPATLVGARVVVNPSLSCGVCPACRVGDDAMCRAKTVVGGSVDGGYGQLCAVPATHVRLVPDHVDLIAAASAPAVFSRAWQSLFVTGKLSIGETVLIHAAASGVTTAGVQLAHAAGARVIVTARTDPELEWARGFGAEFGINTTSTPDVAAAVLDLTHGRGVDLVFDHLGPALFEASIRCLRPRGRLVFCGVTTGEDAAIHLPSVYHRGISLLGSESYSEKDFDMMLAACWAADLDAMIDQTLPIREAAKAQTLMGNDELRGKLVLVHDTD